MRILRKLPLSILFTICFIAVSSIYEYGRIIHERPQPHHIWRQTDCLSLAYNYYDGVGGFLEPSVHHYFSDQMTSGYTAGEFPGYYYMVGMIWRVTGPSELVYRAIGILLHYLGSLALCLAVFRLFKSRWWAITTSLLFFTSPAIVYFTPSFLTDVPAWDLMLIGVYFLVRHATSGKAWTLVVTFLFFCLATLLKVTAGMAMIALGGVLLWETLRRKDPALGKVIFPKRLIAWLCYAGIFAVIMVWYKYAAMFNAMHGGRYTFNGFWPIWEVPPERFKHIVKVATELTIYQVFDSTILIMLAAMCIYMIFQFKHVPVQARLIISALLVGCSLYLMLWFQALDNHDYYLINPQVLPLSIVGVFLWVFQKQQRDMFNSVFTKAAFTLMLVYNVAYAYGNQRMRNWNTEDVHNAAFFPLYHESELPYWSGLSYYSMEDLLTITPYLRSIGIDKNDLVISTYDVTINASLYLMQQRGWTDFSQVQASVEHMEQLIRNGAKYFIVFDPHVDKKPEFVHFMTDQIGTYGNVRIFKLPAITELP